MHVAWFIADDGADAEISLVVIVWRGSSARCRCMRNCWDWKAVKMSGMLGFVHDDTPCERKRVGSDRKSSSQRLCGKGMCVV